MALLRIIDVVKNNSGRSGREESSLHIPHAFTFTLQSPDYANRFSAGEDVSLMVD